MATNRSGGHGKITVAYATHRPEALSGLVRWMERADAVFLEEPPTPGFREMLSGERSIDDYLPLTETEYPEYTRRLCSQLRHLHQGGCRLIQTEPYLARLIDIHETLANGDPPQALAGDPTLGPTYRMEKRMTAALLDLYKAAASGHFDNTVTAVLAFARADAARFRLRDRLRARAILAETKGYRSVCVEAGMMHVYLFAELRRAAAGRYRTGFRFVQADAARAMWGKRHAYGPGDRLTLLLIFHPRLPDSELVPEAARALVYNKLLIKDEIAPANDSYFPHLENEIAAISMVRRLSLDDCRSVHERIRGRSTAEAMETVGRFTNGVF